MNIIREIQKHWFPKTLKCVYRKDILEYALKHHKYKFNGNYGGLCRSIYLALEHYDIYDSPKLFCIIFPLFNNDNAWSLFNGTLYEEDSLSNYWWPKGEWNTGRLDFLKWLLEQYKNDETNLKEL